MWDRLALVIGAMLVVSFLGCNPGSSKGLIETELNKEVLSKNYKIVQPSKIRSMIERNSIGAGIIEFDCFYQNTSLGKCGLVHQLRESFSINNSGLNLIYYGNRMYTHNNYPTIVFFIGDYKKYCSIENVEVATIVNISDKISDIDVFECIGSSLKAEILRKTGFSEDILDIIVYEYVIDKMTINIPLESSVAKMNIEFARIVK